MGTTDVVERAAEPASGRLTLAITGVGRGGSGQDLVTHVLEGIPGVASAYYNADTEMAYVEYRESEVTPSRVLAALEQAGISVGEVTVRTAPQGEAPWSLVHGAALSPDQAAPGPEEIMLDDHSCCGPVLTERADSTGPAVLPSAGDAPARDRTVSEQVQSGWPFKVRLSLFLAAVVVVLGPALWLVRPMSTDAMGADYSVNMSMTGFTPPNFSIPAGKPVSIQFNNVDSPFHGITNGALHQFAIDELGIDVRLDGKQSTVINLPALEPGTYEFYCNVCCGGKVNPSMQGKLTVEGVEGVSQR
jgi:plastocyanin